MDATPSELDSLFEIQQADFDIMHLNRDFDALPQRKLILDLRKKRDEIEKKISKIDALKKEAEKKITRINNEDASLQKKENGTQAAIEAAGGDFRNVEARTKELNGIFKRRQELAENLASAKDELTKIETLDMQARMALQDIDDKEAQATESFKREGGSIKASISNAEKKREDLLSQLSNELASAYLKTSQRMGNVVIGKLEGSRCGVCRATIDQGRLIELRAQAPISYCPICKRLIVIESQGE